MIFAVSSYDYGCSEKPDSQAYEELGFDLDQTCTGEGQGPSCAEPPWATENHHDGPDGIDNAAALLAYGRFAVACMSGPAGLPNLILRVRGYSGLPDDSQVQFAVYYGSGLEPRAGGPDAVDAGSGPRWDGQDRWIILRDMLEPDGGAYDVDQPAFRDDHAYVTGGVLVAHVPQTLWGTGVGTSLVTVYQLVLAGQLARVDGGPSWELRDVVTGVREPAATLLQVVARYPAGPGTLTCSSQLSYDAVKRALCAFVDIASAERSSPFAPCDSLSGSMRLQAKQALLGGIGPDSGPLPYCDPHVAAADDTCDSLRDP